MNLRRLFSALAAAAGLTLVASTGTAQAYSTNPEVYNLSQGTDNCPCTLDDNVDGTYFQQDVGGVGLRSLLYHNGKLVGKVEFHPYDEKLWIYDTANDGDSYTVRIRAGSGDVWDDLGTYSPPGTDKEVEYRVIDFDIPEGKHVVYWTYDGTNTDDEIGGSRLGRS